LGDTDSLYFAAGPAEESDGIFGKLRWDSSAPLLPAEAPTGEFIQVANELLAQNSSIVETDENDRDLTGCADRSDRVFVTADGDNIAEGGSGRDLFAFGDGNNTMFGHEGINLFLTGKGDDFAVGGNDDDLFILGDGNNTACGINGSDIFITGSGDDWIFGGSGTNYIYTGAGNDWIDGNQGHNVISAGTGDDVVYAGSGCDRLILDKGAGSVTVWNFDSIYDSIGIGSTIATTDPISTKLSGLNTLIYAGDDLLATLMNTQAKIMGI
jgi:Ca2+-binding RTX toxin-like protein